MFHPVFHEVDRLGAGNFTWSVAAAVKHQMPLAATAMGAPNVRVSMEDSLHAGEGKKTTSPWDAAKS